MRLVVAQVAHPDQAGIGQLDHERGPGLVLGRNRDLELDLVHLVRQRPAADVELDVDLRRILPLEAFGRVRVLDRQVLHVLRDDPDRRRSVFAVGHRAIRCRSAIEIEVLEDIVGHKECFRRTVRRMAARLAGSVVSGNHRTFLRPPVSNLRERERIHALFICLSYLSGASCSATDGGRVQQTG